ncbi:MAG: response regulator [Deltaproteobacteria bacterium]|jgi:CheY-like chemotaxis protein|nr:response regulator [Deltaproteobacteria bacterium]
MHRRQKAKILVVDDEPDTIIFLSNLLHSDGFKPITADNKKDGLQKAVEEKPAVIILNVMMPGEAGVTMYRNLKRSAQLKSVPVIMLSTIDKKTFLKCHNIYGQYICEEMATMDRFIEKPPEADDFLLTVRELSGYR